MIAIFSTRLAKLLSVTFVAVCAFQAAGVSAANAAPAPEKTARAEIWRGYGDAGYIAPAKKQRSAARAYTKKKTYAAAKRSKKSFASAVKASGYKTKYARKASGKKYAALNYGLNDASPPNKSATGGGVRWVASSSCLNGSLVGLVQSIAANYGPVTVSSTCRSRGHNASVGGAKRSQHLTGDAVDFRVHGNYGGVYVRANAGGVHHYGGGLFHADTGPKRTW
jgi:Peptidase M15